MYIHRRRMMMMTMSTASVASLAIGLNAEGDDWPQWRGANRDGIWREDGITEKLPQPELPILWQYPISSGYSGPSVANGLVYVTDRVEDPKQVERIHCCDAKTGQKVWDYVYDCEYSISYPAGPRATISVANSVAFSLGAMGHLHALNAQDGSLIWQRDLGREYDVEMPIWGISASPLVIDGLLVAQIGGRENACVVALDTKTGREVWRALNEPAQYSAPIIIDQAGKKIVVVWTGASVSGLLLTTGELAWRIDFPVTRMPIGVATPVVHDDRIFMTSFYDGSMMIKFDPMSLTARKLWHKIGKDEQNTQALHSIISTPVFDGQSVYGVDSYGQLRCLDAENGQRLWEDKTATPQERWSTIHFVRQKDHVWMLNEAGELIIAELSRSGYREISRSRLLKPTRIQLARRGGKGVCWSHPAFADKHVFARNDDVLLCASLAQDT